jgi:hypothetical protein
VGGALQALEDRPATAKTGQPEFGELGDEFGPCRLSAAVLAWTHLRILQGDFRKIRLAFQHEGRAPGGGAPSFLF